MASLKKLNINGSYILGKNVKKFEENFSNYLGTNYCVGVANGLDALTISLKSLQLPSNSEILVASNSYIACIISIINAGLKPVLVEPRIDNLDVTVEPRPDTNEFEVNVFFDIIGQTFPEQEFSFILKATR